MKLKFMKVIFFPFSEFEVKHPYPYTEGSGVKTVYACFWGLSVDGASLPF